MRQKHQIPWDRWPQGGKRSNSWSSDCLPPKRHIYTGDGPYGYGAWCGLERRSDHSREDAFDFLPPSPASPVSAAQSTVQQSKHPALLNAGCQCQCHVATPLLG